MTTRKIIFFNFDDLSWDEVAQLPRDIPLILPLGSGYDLGLLADQLSFPPRKRGKVILFPIGHTEQHGYHLPLSVDTIIIDAVAKGTVANPKVATRSYAMPVMPYGVSTHRASFAATMNAGGRAFEDF